MRLLKLCCILLLLMALVLIGIVAIEAEDWQDGSKIGAYGLLLGVFSFVSIVFVLHKIRRGFEVQRTVERKKTTLKMYHKMQRDIRTLNKRLEEKFSLKVNQSKEALDKDDLTFLFTIGGGSSRKKLEEMLSGLDEVGHGVKHGIYDIDLIKDLSVSFVPQIYFKYEPFITKVRKDETKRGQKSLSYDALIDLVKQC